MPKAHIHAQADAKRFGGKPEDYIKIHEWFDATKELIPDNRHRAFRHHSHGIFWAEEVFGKYFINSDGKQISVRDIGESHCLMDFGGFIPTPQDYIQEMEYKGWMQNGGGIPPSHAKVLKYVKERSEKVRKHKYID